jgi:hypothetical protein
MWVMVVLFCRLQVDCSPSTAILQIPVPAQTTGVFSSESQCVQAGENAFDSMLHTPGRTLQVKIICRDQRTPPEE